MQKLKNLNESPNDDGVYYLQPSQPSQVCYYINLSLRKYQALCVSGRHSPD